MNVSVLESKVLSDSQSFQGLGFSTNISLTPSQESVTVRRFVDGRLVMNVKIDGQAAKNLINQSGRVWFNLQTVALLNVVEFCLFNEL